MNNGMPRGRAIAIIAAFLGAPRFVTALTTLIVGVAVFAYPLRQLTGWAGLIGMLLVLVVCAVSSAIARREVIEWRGVLPVSLLIFLGWAIVSLIWSQYRWATLGGLMYLGAFTLLALYVALMRDTIQVVRAFGDVLRVTLIASLAVELLSGILLDTPIKLLGIEGDLASLGPIQGLMGSRNQLGLIALVALITFGTEYRTKSVSRWVGLGSIATAVACIGLSRSPVIAAVLGVVIIAAAALYGIRRVRPDRRTFWQLAILVAVAVAAVAAWISRAGIITLFSANSELSYRVETWQKVWTLIPIHPLEGWGWVGFWHDEIQPFQIFELGNGGTPPSALNGYLDVWFQLGLVGFFLFAALVWLTFARSWLLAGRQRTFVYAWPALVLVALLVTTLAESSILGEYGWLTFVVCCVKAAGELSWRRAFERSSLPEEPLPAS
ncbi:MAG: O-antigen ligase family protein [Rhodoglobus sp.]